MKGVKNLLAEAGVLRAGLGAGPPPRARPVHLVQLHGLLRRGRQLVDELASDEALKVAVIAEPADRGDSGVVLRRPARHDFIITALVADHPTAVELVTLHARARRNDLGQSVVESDFDFVGELGDESDAGAVSLERVAVQLPPTEIDPFDHLDLEVAVVGGDPDLGHDEVCVRTELNARNADDGGVQLHWEGLVDGKHGDDRAKVRGRRRVASTPWRSTSPRGKSSRGRFGNACPAVWLIPIQPGGTAASQCRQMVAFDAMRRRHDGHCRPRGGAADVAYRPRRLMRRSSGRVVSLRRFLMKVSPAWRLTFPRTASSH